MAVCVAFRCSNSPCHPRNLSISRVRYGRVSVGAAAEFVIEGVLEYLNTANASGIEAMAM